MPTVNEVSIGDSDSTRLSLTEALKEDGLYRCYQYGNVQNDEVLVASDGVGMLFCGHDVICGFKPRPTTDQGYDGFERIPEGVIVTIKLEG